MPPPAILLGGGIIAVPVARSLGAAGVPVWALGHESDPVRSSRHCRRFVDVGAGEGVQERMLDWLLGADSPRGVVLPCHDEPLELVARNRAVLEQAGHRPVEANDEVLLAMLDKHRTYELAQRAGVPVPRTVLARPGMEPGELDELGFPCAIKPRHAHHFQRHFGLRRKVFLAADRTELDEHLRAMGALGLEMLVTEIVPGPEDSYHSYYTYMDAHGRPLLHLTKQKLRQYPVGFGLATYHRIHRYQPAIEMGSRFFGAIGARGVLNVEFKLDERDGELKLIECNHRFTAAHELVRHAGIDLGLLAYNRLTGRPDPPLDGYRVGVSMWLPVEDVRAFADMRRAGAITPVQWVRSLLHRQHFQLMTPRDPMPSLRSIARFARRPFVRRRAVPR